jgi:hypothetical protein
MELTDIVDRKHQVRTLPPAPQFVKQRIAQAAELLSQAGDIAVHVELANEALSKLVGVLYQVAPDGVYTKIDSRTYRFLVPAPWGDSGWKLWGLRHGEAVILRGVLLGRIKAARFAPLFDYNDTTRKWHLDVSSYSTLAYAQAYLTHCPVSVAEWRESANAYHHVKATIQQRQRDIKAAQR